MMITVLTCILFLFWNDADYDHGIYLSVMEITYDDPGNAQILIKVFEDDFEIALHNYAGSGIDTTGNFVNNDSLVQAYFDHYLDLRIDSNQLSHVYHTKVKENDSYWLTFDLEIPDKTSDRLSRAIEIHASYFMEIYPDQSNIVKFSSQGHQQFLRLTRKSKAGTFTLPRH